MAGGRARLGLAISLLLAVGGVPVAGQAEPIAFKVLQTPYSRVTFKTEAKLARVIGSTQGAGLDGDLRLDPLHPESARGTVRVDLETMKTGNAQRDAEMKSEDFLNVEGPGNRFAVFELRRTEVPGPLEPGKEVLARVVGLFTVRQKPVEVAATARVTYVRLTPEQVEAQRALGFTGEMLRVRARFTTTFTNHGMQIPELLILKLSNEIQIETDLSFVRP